MRLEPVIGDDPRDILRGLRGALHGAGPALGLGLVNDLPAEVRAGTAVVVTTSGSTGVPKSVILSRDALTASALATAAPDRRRRVAARAAGELRRGAAGARALDRRRPRTRLAHRRLHAAGVLRRGAHDGLDRPGRARPDLHVPRARAADEAAGCRGRRRDGAGRAALVRDDPGRRAGDRRRHPRAGAGCRSPRRAHLRLDRDERRMRLRRPSPPRRVGADQRRRGADRGPDARGGLPRRLGGDGCRVPPRRRRHAGGTAPATPGSSRTTSCACGAASTTSSSRAA